MKRSVILTALAAALTACSGGSSSSSSSNSTGNSSQLSLSVSSNALSADGGVNAGTVTAVTISRIRLSVASLKLEGPAASADAGMMQEIEVKEGPFLVDLQGAALAGSLQQVFDTSVPAGTYREFDLTIAPAAGAALGDLAAQGASLIVDGTFNGAPFSFVSKASFDQKQEGTFTVGDGTGNITLAIDATTWFGPAAAPLDPSVAANAAAIEANIRASFKAFHDDDRNGHDDADDKGQHDGGEMGDDGQHDGGQHDGGEAGDDNGQHDGGEAGDDNGVHDGGEPGDDNGHHDAGTADAGDDHGGQRDGGH